MIFVYFVGLLPVILFKIYGHGPVRPKHIADNIKELKYLRVSVLRWYTLVIMVNDCGDGTGDLIKRTKETDSVACNKKDRANLYLISTESCRRMKE